MTLQVKGLSHLTFICKDLEKTAAIFQDVLGANEIYCSGDKKFSLAKEKFFRLADIWIAIMEGESIEKTYNHVALRVNADELEQFAAKIRAYGLTILKDRKRNEAEGKSLYFYDYDNHLFELHTGDLETRLAFYQLQQDSVIKHVP
ncbi:MAG: FosX/FosE/FosI family fosfomycin resistance hydrolase [Legionellales bacterium]|nr:FosX/FosE/FosI family fosfomycin resistance hydrolase [Legionellales bacterium]